MLMASTACASVVGAIGRTAKVDHLTPVGHGPNYVVSQQFWMQPDQQPYLGVPVDSPASHLVVTMLRKRPGWCIPLSRRKHCLLTPAVELGDL